MNYMKTLFIGGWSDAEECLTISGIAPITIKKGHDLVQRILITDRQNESKFLTRDNDQARWLHFALDYLAAPFEEQSSRSGHSSLQNAYLLMQILADTVRKFGMQQYPPQAEMQKTPDEAYWGRHRKNDVSAAFSHDNATWDVDEQIDNLKRELLKSGKCHDFIYAEENDSLEYILGGKREIDHNTLEQLMRMNHLSARAINVYYQTSGEKMPIVDLARKLLASVSTGKNHIVDTFLRCDKARGKELNPLLELALENMHISSVIQILENNRMPPLDEQIFIKGLSKLEGLDIPDSLWNYAAKHKINIPQQRLEDIAKRFLANNELHKVNCILKYASSTNSTFDCTDAAIKYALFAKQPNFHWAFVRQHTCIDVSKCIEAFAKKARPSRVRDYGIQLKALLDAARLSGYDPDGNIATQVVQYCVDNKLSKCVFETLPTEGVQYPTRVLDDSLDSCGMAILRQCQSLKDKSCFDEKLKKIGAILSFAKAHHIALREIFVESARKNTMHAAENIICDKWSAEQVDAIFKAYRE
jgi:hypothetical protein